jgi:glycosyltransferase involved in cell wall biosynthesis
VKILLVANYLDDGQESMQRFAALLAGGLSAAGQEVRVCRPSAFLRQGLPAGRGVGKWLGYVDKFVVFPSALRAEIAWADVVHICDHANSIYLKYMSLVPHLVTCHDLLAVRSARGEIPQNPTRWSGRRLQQLILRSLKEAQHIVCVSDATRKDLLRLTGLPESRVSRCYNSLNYPYSRMEANEAGQRIRRLGLDPGQSFFLHVGGNQWYKNRIGVLLMFFLLRKLAATRNFHLVMVGKPWTAEMRRFVVSHGISAVTLERSGIADEDLRALYSTAAMMLFPSLDEGFGWPILEAQACGCPVVTSRRPPMNEIGGEAAVYIDPEDPESAAVTVERALRLDSSLGEAGLRNAARFRGSAMIGEYLSLYEKVRRDHAAACAVKYAPGTEAGTEPGTRASARHTLSRNHDSAYEPRS